MFSEPDGAGVASSDADAQRLTAVEPGSAPVASSVPPAPATHPLATGRPGWIPTAALVLVDTVMVATSFYASWAVRYQAEIGPEIEDVNYVAFSVFAPLILVL